MIEIVTSSKAVAEFLGIKCGHLGYQSEEELKNKQSALNNDIVTDEVMLIDTSAPTKRQKLKHTYQGDLSG